MLAQAHTPNLLFAMDISYNSEKILAHMLFCDEIIRTLKQFNRLFCGKVKCMYRYTVCIYYVRMYSTPSIINKGIFS